MKVFLDLGWFFKERKKQYLIGILMLMFVAFLQLLPPKIIGYVVDEISQRTLTTEFLVKWLSCFSTSVDWDVYFTLLLANYDFRFVYIFSKTTKRKFVSSFYENVSIFLSEKTCWRFNGPCNE